LNAQIAYLQAIYRHEKTFQEKLQKIIETHISKIISEKGKISQNVHIINCGPVRNVNIGSHAIVQGVLELTNGTIQSCPEHPTKIGSGVILKDFIVSEGVRIEDHSILDKVYIGQGSKVGKSLSAENSLLFANCEAFHSEICSIFAGPYTVTHHRSTLLIASLFSFFNAGSGTNLSNHMYKLGPVHQGIFERGSKTGSFSYLLLESHISPFSVVIGKHKANVNIEFLPFSYLWEENGESFLIPGKNLFSVGTARDGEKWPNRDQRKAPVKRDLLIFDVFSPFTIEKMRKGRDILQNLYQETPREIDTVQYGGVKIKRLLLRKGVKYYTFAIDRYLIGKLLSKIEDNITTRSSWQDVIKHLQPKSEIKNPEKWEDLAGLITLSDNVENIIQNIKKNKINSINEMQILLNMAFESYHAYEWAYICSVLESEYNFAFNQMNSELILEFLKKWEIASTSLNALILEDSKIEFSEYSKIGFGLGQNEKNKIKDFNAVRGIFEDTAIIKDLEKEREQIKTRIENFNKILKLVH